MIWIYITKMSLNDYILNMFNLNKCDKTSFGFILESLLEQKGATLPIYRDIPS